MSNLLFARLDIDNIPRLELELTFRETATENRGCLMSQYIADLIRGLLVHKQIQKVDETSLQIIVKGSFTFDYDKFDKAWDYVMQINSKGENNG